MESKSCLETVPSVPASLVSSKIVEEKLIHFECLRQNHVSLLS